MPCRPYRPVWPPARPDSPSPASPGGAAGQTRSAALRSDMPSRLPPRLTRQVRRALRAGMAFAHQHAAHVVSRLRIHRDVQASQQLSGLKAHLLDTRRSYISWRPKPLMWTGELNPLHRVNPWVRGRRDKIPPSCLYLPILPPAKAASSSACPAALTLR